MPLRRGVGGMTCLLVVWFGWCGKRVRRESRWMDRWSLKTGGGEVERRMIGIPVRSGLVGVCSRSVWNLLFVVEMVEDRTCGLLANRGFDIGCRSRRYRGPNLQMEGGYMR